MARRISNDGQSAQDQRGIFINHNDALNFGEDAAFTVSGWAKYKQGQTPGNDRLFVKKNEYNTSDGWMVTLVKNSKTKLDIRGASANVVQTGLLPAGWTDGGDWCHLTFVYDGPKVSVYVNGEAALTETAVTPASNNTERFAIGNESPNDNETFKGVIDEVRYRIGTLSADRIKADYETVTKPDFWSASPYKGGFMLYVR